MIRSRGKFDGGSRTWGAVMEVVKNRGGGLDATLGTLFATAKPALFPRSTVQVPCRPFVHLYRIS